MPNFPRKKWTVKITNDGNDIAEFTYDGLGRRIEKKDCVDSNNTRRYYYSSNWQVLCEYDASNTFKQWFGYGNYTDDVLMKGFAQVTDIYPTNFYIHDHLYSPVALSNGAGTIFERYEYDAYGNRSLLNADFTARVPNRHLQIRTCSPAEGWIYACKYKACQKYNS